MLRYFWEDLNPFILAELEHHDLELESFDQIIKKIVDSIAKAAFQPYSSIRKIDQYCPCNNWPANSIISISENSVIKDPQVEKPKAQGLKSLLGLQGFNNNKLFKKA